MNLSKSGTSLKEIKTDITSLNSPWGKWYSLFPENFIIKSFLNFFNLKFNGCEINFNFVLKLIFVKFPFFKNGFNCKPKPNNLFSHQTSPF